MLLVDSSVWVAAERGRIDLVALEKQHDFVVCPPIVHEVLRGANSAKRYQLARHALLNALMIDAPMPLSRFEDAAKLYLRCRNAGYTFSGFDCLIAASAIANEIPLAHRDRDFELIAEVTPLQTLRL